MYLISGWTIHNTCVKDISDGMNDMNNAYWHPCPLGHLLHFSLVGTLSPIGTCPPYPLGHLLHFSLIGTLSRPLGHLLHFSLVGTLSPIGTCPPYPLGHLLHFSLIGTLSRPLGHLLAFSLSVLSPVGPWLLSPPGHLQCLFSRSFSPEILIPPPKL